MKPKCSGEDTSVVLVVGGRQVNGGGGVSFHVKVLFIGHNGETDVRQGDTLAQKNTRALERLR